MPPTSTFICFEYTIEQEPCRNSANAFRRKKPLPKILRDSNSQSDILEIEEIDLIRSELLDKT